MDSEESIETLGLINQKLAKRQEAVPAALDEQTKDLAGLDELVNQLTAVLEPVLGPHTSKDGDPEPDRPEGIAGTIYRHNSQIRSQNHRIRDLLDRLEV